MVEKRQYMSLKNVPALCIVLATTGYALSATASHPIKSAQDIDQVCRYSTSVLEGADAEPVSVAAQRQYRVERRRLLHQVMEVGIASARLSVIDYDHITGVLSVSGFLDKPLFDDAHMLRLRDGGCAFHFDMDEERARDLLARYRMGGVELRVGFLLASHDEYEEPFCSQESEVRKVAGEEPWTHTRTVMHVDLLYAQLVETDGGVLATYQTELGHELHLRSVSQAVGVVSKAIPSVEVTSLSWFSPPSGGQGTGAGDADAPAGGVHGDPTLWKAQIEGAVYPCYLRGLRGNRQLQGAVVVRLPLDQPGDQRPEIMLDTLQVPEVAECLNQRLGAMKIPEPDLKATFLKATLLFRLQ